MIYFPSHFNSKLVLHDFLDPTVCMVFPAGEPTHTSSSSSKFSLLTNLGGFLVSKGCSLELSGSGERRSLTLS